MKKLIQTGICSIVYGTFRDKENQELFRCPRALDDTDLKQYINDSRCLLGFQDDSRVEAVHDVDGKTCLGYYRLYFRDGWHGRWFFDNGGDEKISPLDCVGVNEIIEYLCENYPSGCDWKMRGELSKYPVWCGENRYLLKPFLSEHYKVMFDTTYGNGDYPVRIYVYE